jgi:hypothetical protein
MANNRTSSKPAQSAQQVQIRLHPPQLAMIDRWAREHGATFRGRPSRPAAIRNIVMAVLTGSDNAARPKRA